MTTVSMQDPWTIWTSSTTIEGKLLILNDFLCSCSFLFHKATGYSFLTKILASLITFFFFFF